MGPSERAKIYKSIKAYQKKAENVKCEIKIASLKSELRGDCGKCGPAPEKSAS
jgi:hypothetical protein